MNNHGQKRISFVHKMPGFLILISVCFLLIACSGPSEEGRSTNTGAVYRVLACDVREDGYSFELSDGSTDTTDLDALHTHSMTISSEVLIVDFYGKPISINAQEMKNRYIIVSAGLIARSVPAQIDEVKKVVILLD